MIVRHKRATQTVATTLNIYVFQVTGNSILFSLMPNIKMNLLSCIGEFMDTHETDGRIASSNEDQSVGQQAQMGRKISKRALDFSDETGIVVV